MKNTIAILLLMLTLFSCHRVKDKVDHVVAKAKNELLTVKEQLIGYTEPQPPKASFETRTGLTVADTIFNIREKDTYFPHEGEYSLVFNTSSKQINDWVNNEAPWGKKWKNGPIPYYVMNCSFGLESVGMSVMTDDKGNRDTVYTTKINYIIF